MRWLDVTDSMDMSWSKRREIMKDRKPDVVQSMLSERVRHDLVTERQQKFAKSFCSCCLLSTQYDDISCRCCCLEHHVTSLGQWVGGVTCVISRKEHLIASCATLRALFHSFKMTSNASEKAGIYRE